MKSFLTLVITTVALFPVISNADIAHLEQSSIPVACSSINLRMAELHVKCTTSKGTVFERVSRRNFSEAWKGPDGLIWSDCVGGSPEDVCGARYNQYNAVKFCEKLGGRLPSRADFELGETNGLREVLPHINNYYFWSSSGASADYTGSGYVYHRYLGEDTAYVYYEYISLAEAARCVRR